MKKIIIVLLTLLLISCSVNKPTNENSVLREVQAEETTHELIQLDMNRDMIASMWDFMHKTKDLVMKQENQVYSPVSLYSAMSMLLPATSGSTRDELLAGLGFDNYDKALESLNIHFRWLNTVDEHYSRLMTNSVWLSSLKEDFDPEILDTLQESFLTSSHQIDFKHEEEAKKVISDFINKQTNGFIKDLDVTIDPEAALVLLNTIYVKDKWIVQMDDLGQDEFTLEDGSNQSINFVGNKLGMVNVIKNDQYMAVSQNLENMNSMLFIKPIGSLTEFLKEVDLNSVYQELLDNSSSSRFDVNFKMPEVDVSSNLNGLKEVLKTKGFEETLSDNPLLSYYEGQDDGMFVSDIIQQARMKVDKEGVEAAAYTEIIVSETAAPEVIETIDFDLDKPYLMILLSPYYVPLFITTIYNPSQTD